MKHAKQTDQEVFYIADHPFLMFVIQFVVVLWFAFAGLAVVSYLKYGHAENAADAGKPEALSKEPQQNNVKQSGKNSGD